MKATSKRLGVVMVPVTAIVFVAAVLTGILLMTGGTLDVIGKGAVTSFSKLLDAEEVTVTADEEHAGWSLESPDGSVRFIWSGDYSSSPLYDVMLEFDVQPFLAAGLDPEKLSENYTLQDGKLTVGIKYGKDHFSHENQPTPLGAFEHLEKSYRSSIGYHSSMGHYNITLGEEALFEWAQDMSANHQDIVFALSPEPLISAGVDPEQVEGWSYAQVMVGHSDASETAWKLLKSFDIQ